MHVLFSVPGQLQLTRIGFAKVRVLIRIRANLSRLGVLPSKPAPQTSLGAVRCQCIISQMMRTSCEHANHSIAYYPFQPHIVTSSAHLYQHLHSPAYYVRILHPCSKPPKS